jgi:hypothetical protein
MQSSKSLTDLNCVCDADAMVLDLHVRHYCIYRSGVVIGGHSFDCYLMGQAPSLEVFGLLHKRSRSAYHYSAVVDPVVYHELWAEAAQPPADAIRSANVQADVRSDAEALRQNSWLCSCACVAQMKEYPLGAHSTPTSL